MYSFLRTGSNISIFTILFIVKFQVLYGFPYLISVSHEIVIIKERKRNNYLIIYRTAKLPDDCTIILVYSEKRCVSKNLFNDVYKGKSFCIVYTFFLRQPLFSVPFLPSHFLQSL